MALIVQPLFHQAVDVLEAVPCALDDLGAGQFQHRQFHGERFRHGRLLRLLLDVFA
ncbi:hypothetical protein [Streptomyces sp. NPDC050287]|uniref:hypothetical protein n=1 Tax=Streptomyces sp. NPDC050287 TaxID=3365608 RepID=UPI003798F6E2